MAEVGNTNQIEMNNSQQSSVKTCKKCGMVLSLDEFYKRKKFIRRSLFILQKMP